MKKLSFRKNWVTPLICFLIAFSFFVPNLLVGKIPFPGDSLLGLYHPFRDATFNGYSQGKFPVKNTLTTDPVLQTYPWKYITVKNFKNLSFPFWNPYSFSGQPLLGGVQSAPFGVMTVLFFILPFNAAWASQIILSISLTSVFMYLFLGSIKNPKLSKKSSMLGAVLLPFTGFFVAWQQWGTVIVTAMWLPLILFCINRVLGSRQKRWYFLLVFSLSQSLLSGHLQTAMYVIAASFIYILISCLNLRNKIKFSLLLSVFFISFLITSPFLLPAAQFIQNSARSSDQSYYPGRRDWFIPPAQLIQLIIPDYFGNPTTNNYWGVWNYGEFVSFIAVVPFYLATLSLTSRKKYLLFPATLLLISLLLSIKNPISLIPYASKINFVSSLQPSRIIFLLNFSVIILATYGIDYFLKTAKNRQKIIAASITLLAVVTPLGLSVFYKNLFPLAKDINTSQVALRNSLLPAAISTLILFSCLMVSRFPNTRKNLLYILIVALAIFELFRFAYKFTPFTKSSLVFPQTDAINFLQSQNRPYRIITTDRRIFHPNVSAYYGIESVDGYDPLYLKSYANFVASWQADTYKDGVPSFGRIITPQKLKSPLLNLLNVKYILSFDDLEKEGFKKVFQQGETKIFENPNVLPRAFFVSEVIKNDKQQEFNSLLTPSFNLRSSATSSELEFPTDDSPSNLSVIFYSDQSLKLRSKTEGTKALLLTIPYDNGWQATVDGNRTKIFKADSIFQSILVPGGTHVIEFRYAPQSWPYALLLSAAGFALLLFVSFNLWPRRFQS